jgi:hypothetical protein
MSGDAVWIRFVAAALATWRITHLIVHEDGPWDAIARIRRRAGPGFWGQLMDCSYCTSLWVSALAAFVMRPSFEQWVLYWLALSGAACILDRIGSDPVIIQSAGNPGQGAADDVVLRTETGAGEDGSGRAGASERG